MGENIGKIDSKRKIVNNHNMKEYMRTNKQQTTFCKLAKDIY